MNLCNTMLLAFQNKIRKYLIINKTNIFNYLVFKRKPKNLIKCVLMINTTKI